MAVTAIQIRDGRHRKPNAAPMTISATNGMDATCSTYWSARGVSHARIASGASGWFGFGRKNDTRSTPGGLLRHLIGDDSNPASKMRTPTAYNTGESITIDTGIATDAARANRRMAPRSMDSATWRYGQAARRTAHSVSSSIGV